VKFTLNILYNKYYERDNNAVKIVNFRSVALLHGKNCNLQP